MSRFHNVDGVMVSYTPEEEAARDAEELAFEQAAWDRAKATLADNRYNAEVGGITVGGVSVDTDRDTQGTLTAARIIAKEDDTYTVQWKTSGGFVTLDAATIIVIADAVRTHVQSCYSNEAVITGQIDGAADMDSLRAVNLDTGWS